MSLEILGFEILGDLGLQLIINTRSCGEFFYFWIRFKFHGPRFRDQERRGF